MKESIGVIEMALQFGLEGFLLSIQALVYVLLSAILFFPQETRSNESDKKRVKEFMFNSVFGLFLLHYVAQTLWYTVNLINPKMGPFLPIATHVWLIGFMVVYPFMAFYTRKKIMRREPESKREEKKKSHLFQDLR